MDRYPFLSDEWIAAAKQLRAEYGDLDDVPANIRMNLVITDVPFGDGKIDAHIDTTSGSLEMDLGHLDKSDVAVTLDYATARAVFVDGTVGVAMKAFMEGRVRVQGEMAKLLGALQQMTPSDQSSVTEVQQKIRDVTE